MGSGIAEAVAGAGHDVRLFEAFAAARAGSRERIAASTELAVDRGKLDAPAREALLGRIAFADAIGELADCELLIEAIIEDAGAKTAVLAELEGLVSPQALIASNTSSIPIAALASALARPQRMIGLHFFSPVPVMGLVEIVSALDTSAETIAAAESFVASLGKAAVHSRDRSGFIVNMLLVPYLVSAIRMLEEGFASREDIDRAMTLGCGHPMGPLKLCDFIGLDVICGVCDALFDEFRRPELAPPPLLRRMVSAGRLGRKSGRGFYEYQGAGG